jgi:phosphatidylserine/phosphatidylglycerophosphate/cardiolipin synthase-like enzyme
MGTLEKDDYKLIHGRGVGNQLTEAVNKAENRIWVVTPWISKKYAKQLVKKHDNGVDVKLMTTDDLGNSAQKKSLNYLIDTWKEEKGQDLSWLRKTGYGLILGGLALAALAQSPAPTLISVLGAGAAGYGHVMDDFRKVTKIQKNMAFQMFNGDYHSHSSLTHSKIYILDDQVFVGSANFTEHGLWQNIEVMFQFQDEELKEEARDIFDSIDQSVETEEVDVTEVAQKMK